MQSNRGQLLRLILPRYISTFNVTTGLIKPLIYGLVVANLFFEAKIFLTGETVFSFSARLSEFGLQNLRKRTLFARVNFPSLYGSTRDAS